MGSSTDRLLTGSTVGATRDIHSMYEHYPYPPANYDGYKLTVPWVLEHLELDLAGKSVLDFGCGTGKKLCAMADAYPETKFTGVDLSAASLKQARHRIGDDRPQVELVQGDLFEMEMEGEFDVITSLGVVHHLERPVEGLRRLSGLLADDGVIVLALYHSLGTFPTLLKREVLLSLLGSEWSGLPAVVELLEDFLRGQDASRPTGASDGCDDITNEVDALVNPIVNAYRFDDCLDLVRDAGLAWGSVDFVLHGNPLQRDIVDFGTGASLPPRALDGRNLFPGSPLCQEKFEALGVREKLRVLELMVSPVISGVLAGNGPSLRKLDDRVRRNAVAFG